MSQDNTAVNAPVVAEPTTTDPAPVETKEPAAVDLDSFDIDVEDFKDPETEQGLEDAEEGMEDKTDKVESTEPEEADSNPDETDKPQGKAEDRKQQLNTEIRDLVAQRNTLKAQVEEMNGKVYQPATESELLEQVNPETGEYFNPLEAKVAAMEQRQEIERYNTQVTESRLTLTHEANKALQDFPMFDEQSKEYKPEIAQQADQLLGANLIVDQNTGQVIGSHVSPYQLYKTIADAARASATEGQVKAQRATEKMLANADTPTNSPTKEAPKDSFLQGFDSV